jgi:hypothetical protein
MSQCWWPCLFLIWNGLNCQHTDDRWSSQPSVHGLAIAVLQSHQTNFVCLQQAVFRSSRNRTCSCPALHGVDHIFIPVPFMHWFQCMKYEVCNLLHVHFVLAKDRHGSIKWLIRRRFSNTGRKIALPYWLEKELLRHRIAPPSQERTRGRFMVIRIAASLIRSWWEFVLIPERARLFCTSKAG